VDKKSIVYNPIYFFYDLIHLISILLKIQSLKSILLDMDINLIYILYIL